MAQDCPECGIHHPVDRSTCDCGHKFSLTPYAASPNLDVPSLINCPVCKGPLSSNAPSCPHCGHVTHQTNPGWLLVRLLGGIAGLGVLGYSLYSAFRVR